MSSKPPFLVSFHSFPQPRKPNQSSFLSDPEGTLPSCLAPGEHSQLPWKGHLNISDSAGFFFPPFPPPSPGLASSLSSIFHAPRCPQGNSVLPLPLQPTSHPHLPPASFLLSDDRPLGLFFLGVCLRLLAKDVGRSRGKLQGGSSVAAR